jgi:mono/diheme cytochrome c family protein
MPPFSASMSDEDIAAVVSYVRTAWGNRGAVVSSFEVGRLRGAPAE